MEPGESSGTCVAEVWMRTRPGPRAAPAGGLAMTGVLSRDRAFRSTMILRSLLRAWLSTTVVTQAFIDASRFSGVDC